MMRPRFRFSPAVPYWRGVMVLVMLVLAGLACDVTTSTAHFENAKLYKDPESQTVMRVFRPDETIYLRARLKNAPDNTPLKTIWILKPDTIELVYELTAGNGAIAFEATPPDGGWPPGDYRVDLYVNGDRMQSLDFQVH